MTLAPEGSYRVGRDPRSDVTVDDPRVSWRHAVLRMEQDRWLLEDLGNTNGTFLGPDRVRRVEITSICQLRLGHPDDGQVLACSVSVPQCPDSFLIDAIARQKVAVRRNRGRHLVKQRDGGHARGHCRQPRPGRRRRSP
jgi:pSer/pThr/pTyr-binding forkhead associated (FHA) protein